MQRCDRLASISESSNGLTRRYLTAEHAEANRVVASWMSDAGLRPVRDAAGNQCGTMPADSGPRARTILLGSHLDTVRDAGRFDGTVGVLIAIEAVRAIVELGVPRPFALEVVGFADEEGTRFGTALLGSSALAGTWDDDWWALADDEGVLLLDAFERFGLDPARVSEAARRPDDVLAYLEAHIEQGPELEQTGRALGVVTSIASARRESITFTGRAGHGGGTRYPDRRDALVGASEAIVAIDDLCRSRHHIVGTMGRIEVYPGAVNSIAGTATFTLDLRGELDDARDGVWASIAAILDGIASRRALTWSVESLHDAPAVFCAPRLQAAVAGGIEAAGEPEPPRLFSRAGHDAMAVASITDVGMMFLRNPGGISHHPDEDVAEHDVARAVDALVATVVALGEDPAGG
jgi:allantoate deiminase